ncbi:MAG TPA: mechanosensitive ion channel domain-containing protein [Candidatus Polarisedimenticolia bacterium]|nr:mechanosensitive ion channel domain-containing protein [Candidatus Polarisedimenticolia bacterium]
MKRINAVIRTLCVSCLLILAAPAMPLARQAAVAPDAAAAGDEAQESPLAAEAGLLLEQIGADRAELRELRRQRDAAEGEERVILSRRLMNKGLEVLARLDALVANVLAQEKKGLDATEFRGGAEELVKMLGPLFRQRIKDLQDRIVELGKRREGASGNELIELEAELASEHERLNTILGEALKNTRHMTALGLDARQEEAYLGDVLAERAATEAARLQLALEEIARLRRRLADDPDNADTKSQLQAAEGKRDRSAQALDTSARMLDRVGIDTGDYQTLLIEATGQVSTRILDKGVAIGLFQQWLSRLRQWAIDSGPGLLFKALLFILILLIFHLLSRLARKVVRQAVTTSRLQFSQLLQNMFISTAGNVVLFLGLLVALSQLGVALGPLLAGLGIAGFIVGFALQEVLGNFAAGVMILVYRPYDVGDLIEAAGVSGKVDEMSMVSTTIMTIDNQTLVVPNGKIWGDVIKNVTAQRIRRVDMVFGISYGDDIPKTEQVLAAILREHPKVLDDPEPVIRLHKLNDSSVDFVVRPWVLTDDYWEVYWDVTREVKMRFDREGISIPFPQRDVHFYDERKPPSAAS